MSWYNYKVYGSVWWPRREIQLKFNEINLILMPSSDRSVSSIHVFVSHGRNLPVALTAMNEFFSLLAYRDNAFLYRDDFGFSVHGNPRPNLISDRPDGCPTKDAYFDKNLDYILDERKKLALAFFREGKNAMSFGYKLLNYHKIWQLAFKPPGGKFDKEKAGKYIKDEETRSIFLDSVHEIRNSICHCDEEPIFNPDYHTRDHFRPTSIEVGSTTTIKEIESATRDVMEKALNIIKK